jgi:hypothetical protein
MARYDDDDWVGTPPEGRHTREQADPDHWSELWIQYRIRMGILGLMVIGLIVAIILR